MDLSLLREVDAAYHMPVYARLPVAFARGQGMRLFDTEGKQYLDFLSGLGVVNLGHSDREVAEAVFDQMGTLVHVSNLYLTEPQLKLAERLNDLAMPGKVFFANSGAEANECAIKLARRWGKLHKGDGCVGIITAERSFHGRTMKTLAATGQRDKQEPFEPLPPGFTHVPLNDLEALRGAIDDDTVAVMLEVIQGEGGVYPCDEDYLGRVRALCDEKGLLLMLDEVQTGFGRTGAMFAFEHYGVVPDVLTMAKALANGLPIGACVARPEVADAFKPGEHGSTFGGGPVVCRAALATLDRMEAGKLAGRAAKVGEAFKARLAGLAERLSSITEVRGRGLMLGVELSVPEARFVVLDALEAGFVIGSVGDSTLRFLPPLIVSQVEIDELMTFLARRLTNP